MTDARLSPNLVPIDIKTGKFTAEGFRFFQAITQAVSGGGTFQPLSPILTGVAGMGTSTGLVAQTAPASFNKRTIQASSPILVANANGVGGDPTFSGDIASNAEAIAGTDTTKIIVPSSLAAVIAAAGGSYQPLDADLTSWAGVTRAAGYDAFTATPSSANLASLVTDEVGTGSLVFVSSGTWTPALTFATPGNLVVAYTWQIGEWYRFGNMVVLFFAVLTSTFTHTTAAGNLQITGFPVAAKTLANMRWTVSLAQVQGITKVNYTQFMGVVNSAGSLLTVVASGSAQATAPVTFSDVPTGGTVTLTGCVMYSV